MARRNSRRPSTTNNSSNSNNIGDKEDLRRNLNNSEFQRRHSEWTDQRSYIAMYNQFGRKDGPNKQIWNQAHKMVDVWNHTHQHPKGDDNADDEDDDKDDIGNNGANNGAHQRFFRPRLMSAHQRKCDREGSDPGYFQGEGQGTYNTYQIPQDDEQWAREELMDQERNMVLHGGYRRQFSIGSSSDSNGSEPAYKRNWRGRSDGTLYPHQEERYDAQTGRRLG